MSHLFYTFQMKCIQESTEKNKIDCDLAYLMRRAMLCIDRAFDYVKFPKYSVTLKFIRTDGIHLIDNINQITNKQPQNCS